MPKRPVTTAKITIKFTAIAIFKRIKSQATGDANVYYGSIVAQKYNIYMQNPSGPKEFSLGDEQYLQFTG